MRDERLQEITMILDEYGIADERLEGTELANWLRELKAARKEIARWEALPPRMTEAVIRPVYPISDTEEGKEELEKEREIATLREANRVLSVELTETITLIDRGKAYPKPIIDEDQYGDG